MFARLRARATAGPHSHDRINRQRFFALVLVATGLMRAAAWTTLIALYLTGVPFTADLFKSVAFVAVISLYANAATDFGQACASLAQLTAGDAHAASERAHAAIDLDTEALSKQIADLAQLPPSPRATALAEQLIASLRR